MAERLVVIGGDAAGMSAASQARRVRDADDLEIVAFERGPFTSYSACGIPYFVGGAVEPVDRLVVRTPAEFEEKQAITVHTGTEVTAIDLDRATVTVRSSEEGAQREVGFDQLMIATGSTPIRPSLPGIGAEGIFGVQVLSDGIEISRMLGTGKPERAVVVGGGYIGLEMAEALVSRGLDVTLVDLATQPLPFLDQDMGALVAQALDDHGVHLRLGEPVTGFGTDGGRVTAVETPEGPIPADIVVLGLGVRPNVALAAAAGIPIGQAGGIVVDPAQRTPREDVWAAGDCVESHHRVLGKPVVVALGTHANKQGRVAGINIGGGHARFEGVVGTAVTRLCAVEVAFTGLSERQATAAGFDAFSVVVESTTRAGYFPGAQPITTRLVTERGSGRLLGGQIVGKEGAAKRIDVLAMALWNRMTVGELQGTDLGYAPPFSPVWDPVLIAARKASEALAGAGSRG